MAHFAQLNAQNIVVSVLVVADDDTADGDGNEVEAVGVAFLESCFGNDHPAGTTYVQTSYRTIGGEHPDGNPLRYNFAAIGDIYDPTRDAFIEPNPSVGWILADDGSYQPPTPRPDDGIDDEGRPVNYYWDNDSEAWEPYNPTPDES